MLIINAVIKTIENGDIENGYIIIEENKIKEVGKMSDLKIISPLSSCLDAEGKIVTPGFVDAHCHIGMWEDGLNFEGDDGNEDTDPITPQLNALDAINPMDRAFKEALDAGVTTVITGPGSANAIGGQLIAMKTYGQRIDHMIIKAPVAVKAALGENPKSVYHDKNQTPSTRMATAALIREALYKAKEYMEELDDYQESPEENDKPSYDAKCEALLPVLRREIPLHIHAHRADDIFTAIRIAKAFHIKLVLVHGTEGHLIADALKDEGYPILTGPILTDRSKPELNNQSEKTPAILHAAGLPIAITTDHPEVPLKHIRLCAAVAIRAGLSPAAALSALTLWPAQICGIDDRIGSIVPGKDADLLLWNGDPLDIYSTPKRIV